MTTMKTIARSLVALTLLAGGLHAAGLSKYKDWGNSPEAYFLSSEERTKWSQVRSDADAEKFIAEYRASRGKGFEAAIKSRIDYADKNFSLGKKKGSETLRGRTLIVFGPPSRVSAGTVTGGQSKIDPSSGEITSQGGGGDKGGGNSGSNPYSNTGGAGADTLRAMQATSRSVSSTWIYDGSNVPPALKTKDLTLEFTVMPDDAKEEVKDREKLDQMLATVVEYWKPKKA